MLTLFSRTTLASDVASGNSAWGEVQFNASALKLDTPDSGGQTVDLSVFSTPGGQAPGVYNVSVYRNDVFIEKRNITFVAPNAKEGESTGLLAQLTPKQLFAMGVKTGVFPSLDALGQGSIITDLGHYIPAATATLNFYKMRLDVSIPQIALESTDKNYAPPSSWDDGIPAILLSYNLNGSERWQQNGQTSQSQFLGLNGGVNLGVWRYRNSSVYTHDDVGGGQWSNNSNYVQRDIRSLHGHLTAGDAGTSSDVFDSVSFRGVQLASDSSMMPGRFSSFAPVVRGIANSHAQVTVRQNGNVIYQTYVAPGPFALNDLSPSGSGGPLEVTIKEANGQIRVFVQPFASLPNLMREGGFKYELAAGRIRQSEAEVTQKPFALFTGTYGAPHSVTFYGGIIGASTYQSYAIGTGLGLGAWGAVSIDITHARAFPSESASTSGEVYRIRYAKALNELGTNLTLASSRYSTRGFRSFNDFSQLRAGEADTTSPAKQEHQLTLSQTLGDAGSLSLSVTQDAYWDDRSRRNISAVYSGNIFGASYTVAYTESAGQVYGRARDRQVALTVQVPISQLLAGTWMSYGMTHDVGAAGARQAVSFGGTALDNNQLSYSLQAGLDASGGASSSGGGSLAYRGTYGTVNSGYSKSSGSRQWTYGYQGGVLVHPYGLTLGQSFTDGVALVRAPGASGVSVSGTTGVSTDWRGYAIVPSVAPYRVNEINLETNTLGRNVDITGTSMKKVTPSKGAVVLANFVTRVGEKVLFKLTHHSSPVPFGARVNVQGSDNMTIVADDGEVYLTGVPVKGHIIAQWGKEASARCETDFVLLPRVQDKEEPLREMTLVCR